MDDARKTKSENLDSVPFMDPGLPLDVRTDDLVSRMTLEEKVSQMLYSAPGIPRLGVPEYNWWNECLHGVARAGVATVFPQSIGMGASWDVELMHEVAVAISDEARAKHHELARRGDRGIYKGLTHWSPNVNIFRDPRWGRGQETYGEDPFLTSRMGVAFVKGLQGDHPKYLKLVATPKHYAVHSGPEPMRHHFDARVSEKDLRETYLPAFKACICEGGAYSIMGAYNRTNGEPCCASKVLLEDILRDEWGFKGYVVSDCGAIQDIHAHHKVTDTPEESAALAVKRGCDLNCGSVYRSLMGAVHEGLIAETDIDVAVKRLFKARFLLGMFDPPEHVPYAQIPYEVNASDEHRSMSLKMARESIVLLKNEGSLLPLKRDLKTVAVIGPNAHSCDVLLGNYFGTPSRHVTALEGIREKVSPSTRVLYAQGCELVGRDEFWGAVSTRGFAEAVAAAERSDVTIVCLGLSPKLEGEEGDVAASDGGGDRTDIELPKVQQALLETICAAGRPVALVLFGGSPLAVTWAHEHVPAIIDVWYPGEEGGTAIADVLFGDYSPAGRLPVTFVKSLAQLPAFTDYRMQGRTYRYMKEEPLYPFGYGLSYASFDYDNLVLDSTTIAAGESLDIGVTVQNTSKVKGDEVAQVYLEDLQSSVERPIRELVGFCRVTLKPGEKRALSFTITPRQMALIDTAGRCVLEPGRFRIHVGGRQPDNRSHDLTGTKVLCAEYEVRGSQLEVEY